MAGLSHRHGALDRLQVPELADEDDIGVLTQSAAEGVREPVRVRADLPLVHHRPAVAVEVLDGVLDGENVAGAALVDMVDHAGQSGGLARARLPGHEDEPAVPGGQVQDNLRQAQVLNRRDLRWDGPQGRGDRAALHVDVDAEAPEPLDAVREIELMGALEPLHVAVGEDVVDEPLSVDLPEGLEGERVELAVHPHNGREVDGDVQVGGAALNGHLAELIEPHRLDAHDLLLVTGRRDGLDGGLSIRLKLEVGAGTHGYTSLLILGFGEGLFEGCDPLQDLADRVVLERDHSLLLDGVLPDLVAWR